MTEEEDEPEPVWTQPPAPLVAAFRASEAVEAVGVLLVEDGFDAVTMRVLSAWENTDNRWSSPKDPQPSDGRPTAAAWRWLVSGWIIDYGGIADGAGVSRDVARERMAVLLHARLVYPDGGIAKAAKQAMGATIRGRLKSEQAKQPKDRRPKEPSGGAAPAN